MFQMGLKANTSASLIEVLCVSNTVTIGVYRQPTKGCPKVGDGLRTDSKI